jgi:hypothetical protein
VRAKGAAFRHGGSEGAVSSTRTGGADHRASETTYRQVVPECGCDPDHTQARWPWLR